MAVRYKFVEVAPVTDDKLEATVNRWVGDGWSLDTIHFAMRDASHRPAMAFVSFVRDAGDDDASSPKPEEEVEDEQPLSAVD